MIYQRLIISTFALFISVASATHAVAQLQAPYFFDDFEDGSIDDASPVTWDFQGWTKLGTKTVEEGSLVVTPAAVSNGTPGYDPNSSEANIYPANRIFKDVSIRLQFRVLGKAYSQVVPVLRDHLGDDGVSGSLIWAGIDTDGGTGIGTWTPDGNADSGVYWWGSDPNIRFDYPETDVRMKIDHFGKNIELTIWDADKEMPRDPQVVAEVPDGEFEEPGRIAISVLSDLRQGVVPVAFRYIAALPTAYLAGDFNDDGQLTSADMDLLTLETLDTRDWWNFDLNSDKQVDPADRTYWVHELKKSYLGDSNLDGAFDSRDLIGVFQRGHFEDSFAGNSTWADGDWNGDKDFTSADFVVAFQDGGYDKGPRAALVTVPEPTGYWILCGLVMTATRITRRTS